MITKGSMEDPVAGVFKGSKDFMEVHTGKAQWGRSHSVTLVTGPFGG